MPPITLRKPAAALAAVLCAGGCRGGDHPAAMPAVREYTLVQAAASAPELSFSEITDLQVDAASRVYVGDRDAGISVLSPSGALERKVGRGGEGPGEFRYVSNLALLPGDSLFVYDGRLSRVTVFPPGSGTPAYTVNLLPSANRFPIWVTPAVRPRGWIALFRPAVMAGASPRADLGRRDVLRLLNVDGSLARDSLRVVPAREDLIVRTAGGGVSVRQNPFGREGIFRTGPDGALYYGWTDSLAITTFSAAGTPIREFRAAYHPRPVTREDVDRAVASVAAYKAPPLPGFAGLQAGLQRAMRNAAPATWPAFTSFVVDDARRVWVALPAADGEPVEWDGFTPAGVPFARLHLPARAVLKALRGSTAYAVATDSLDVPRVVMYRITPHLP